MMFKTHFGYLVVYVHFVEYGGAVVGGGDLSVGRHEDFVHSVRAQRGPQRRAHRLSRQNVRFNRFYSRQPVLSRLKVFFKFSDRSV